MSVKVATIAGAWLRRTAAAMCSAMLRKDRPIQKRQRFIEGFLVSATRQGARATARIIDMPGWLAVIGTSQTAQWPFSLLDGSEQQLCPAIASRDVFLGLADGIGVVDGSGAATLAYPPVVGEFGSSAALAYFGARQVPGVGASVSRVGVQVTQSLNGLAFATGAGWVLASYAEPTFVRAAYAEDATEPQQEIAAGPLPGVSIATASLLSAWADAYIHPPRPSDGWRVTNAVAQGESACAWVFSAPYPSAGTVPNQWLLMQVMRGQSDNRDHIGRRCLVLVNLRNYDAGSFTTGRWLIDPATAYSARAPEVDGNSITTFNYHAPSAPLVLSDGQCLFFDAYYADALAGGSSRLNARVRRYTLALYRATVSGVTQSVLHTSDIALRDDGGLVDLAPGPVEQYHFEGADVADDDTVVAILFGSERFNDQVLTVYRIEDGSASVQQFNPTDFRRCVFANMNAQSGINGHENGHWGVNLREPGTDGEEAGAGWWSGADKVTYIGNRRWAFYVSTDVVVPTGSAAYGSLAVAIYDANANAISLAGVIAEAPMVDGQPAGYGITARLGRMDCVVKERDDQAATIIATFGTDCWWQGATAGISAGQTFISYDSGETWQKVLDCGSPAGTVYCGSIVQARTDPIARGL